MNNNVKLLDWIAIISFLVGLYALYITLENLKLNDNQSNELKQILEYLEEHLEQQDIHLENQDKLIASLRGGEGSDKKIY